MMSKEKFIEKLNCYLENDKLWEDPETAELKQEINNIIEIIINSLDDAYLNTYIIRGIIGLLDFPFTPGSIAYRLERIRKDLPYLFIFLPKHALPLEVTLWGDIRYWLHVSRCPEHFNTKRLED